MRTVIQRVSQASVSINNTIEGQIGKGMLILLGIEAEDTDADIDWLVNKINKLRIFSDENDKMNLSVEDVKGDFLVISQFTLYASTKKGNRPSYLRSAKPDIAIPMYEKFLLRLKEVSGRRVEKGIFGADMKVSLLNDGPVTIQIDTRNKE